MPEITTTDIRPGQAVTLLDGTIARVASLADFDGAADPDIAAIVPGPKRLHVRVSDGVGGFDGGTTFTDYFASTPLCCPARTTLPTGRYAHNHGGLQNGDVEDGDQPVDERLLDALEQGLPDCAGVALGIERLLMCLLQTDDIRQVLAIDFAHA